MKIVRSMNETFADFRQEFGICIRDFRSDLVNWAVIWAFHKETSFVIRCMMVFSIASYNPVSKIESENTTLCVYRKQADDSG